MRTLKEWAEEKKEQLIKDIEYFMSEGINKEVAFNMVINGTCLGSGLIKDIRTFFDIK